MTFIKDVFEIYLIITILYRNKGRTLKEISENLDLTVSMDLLNLTGSICVN